MDIAIELQKNGMLLNKIPRNKQTLEMCELAINQNPLALQYVGRKLLNDQLCLRAVKKEVQAFRYVPSKFVTKEMCEIVATKEPNLLDYVPEKKRYELFDDKTDITLIKKIVEHKANWLVYMPNRPDVRQLCIKYMKKDFSYAQYMPEQIKKSDDILAYQRSKGELEFLEKIYVPEERVFKVKIVCGKNVSIYDKGLYDITIEFEDFKKFYDFLNGNLFNAELRSFDFVGIDLKRYNIKGAVINSEILEAQGLYDGTYFSMIKERIEDNKDEIIENNEITILNEFYYLKPVDDEAYERKDGSHIPFFYISDIHLEHRVYNRFTEKATIEEIHSYIKYLARKMVSSIGTIPYNSYLLIAGDTSSIFEFNYTFYNELIQHWNPSKIIVVAGNHELWDPWDEMGKNIDAYRRFFDKLGIIFLQNDLLYVEYGKKGVIYENEILNMAGEAIREQVQYSSVIILGGIGFSGLNKEFNASNIRYGKSFDELSRGAALQKDIFEASHFNIIYTKLLKSLYQNRVIVLTHTKKEDWNTEIHNPHWIYLNGHNHRNFYEVNDGRKIYADNQIGYKAKNIGLKYFYCDNAYDIFAYWPDGVHEITKGQYVDFNRGKCIPISFRRVDGTIYMLKKNNMYMFTIYCKYSKNSWFEKLYLLNGGKLIRLERDSLKDISYYYDNLEKYTENINQLLKKYTEGQQKLSEFIKHLGGSGKIHGCIVDVERPNELQGFSYCHLFVNPIDGRVTPYFAYDVSRRIIYRDLKTLLQAHNRCKSIADNYIRLENEFTSNLPVIQYSDQENEWENGDYMYDEGGFLYKISRIIKSLQYCIEKNVVRLWNEQLLNYDFISHIKQTRQIEDIVDDRLLFDEKSI